MINPDLWGVSFSIKQCKAFGIAPGETLEWLIYHAGFRRFRLMSYWNEHEKSPGQYDFTALDLQLEMIAQVGGQVTLCLGARQPRWPENHWPDWAWELPKADRTAALLRYIEIVVERYKQLDIIISWQLENEAFLNNFGRRIEIDRGRLLQEFALIKRLDPSRPLIMSTSNGWGIPLRQPVPDIVGFSYYDIMHNHGKYSKTIHRPWLYVVRKALVRWWWDKPVFIHELQCEPWGPKPIWHMDLQEQSESMDPTRIAHIISAAKTIQAPPVDLWGGEWWYWRYKKHHDESIWNAISTAIKQQA